MTYGEWIVHWKEVLPMENGVFSFPPRPPKRMDPKEACDYYNKKLADAFCESRLKKLKHEKPVVA